MALLSILRAALKCQSELEDSKKQTFRHKMMQVHHGRLRQPCLGLALLRLTLAESWFCLHFVT